MICKFLNGNNDLCRKLLNNITRGGHNNKYTWFAKRIFSKNGQKRKCMSSIISFLVSQLTVSDCQRPHETSKASQAISALQNSSSDDDDYNNSCETKMKSNKGDKIKSEQLPVSNIESFYSMMEKLQIYAMKGYLYNEEYFNIYLLIIQRINDDPQKKYLLNTLYEFEVISAIIHCYCGNNSLDEVLPELPSWSSFCDNDNFTRIPNKDPMLNVLQCLIDHCDSVTQRAFDSLQSNHFTLLMLRDHPGKTLPFLELMIKGNGETSMTVLKNLLTMCKTVTSKSNLYDSSNSNHRSSRKKIKTEFDIVIELLIKMLIIEDQFTETRLRLLMCGGQKSDVIGLQQIAATCIHYSKHNPRQAERAYIIIKIISVLDQQVRK